MATENGEPRRGLGFVIFGSTGAVGSTCVRQLLDSEAKDVAKIFTVGRRRLHGVRDDPRLVEIIVESLDDVDKDVSVVSRLKGNVDISLCCLGTTRQDAGSAAQFKKVDVEYVGVAARLSKAAGARAFGLISAQGANKNVWANDMKIFHGLLYAKSKGMAEELAKEAGFPYTAILRPGLLERGSAARMVEKLGARVLPSVSVEQVARCMIRATTEGARQEAREAVVETLEMKDLQ